MTRFTPSLMSISTSRTRSLSFSSARRAAARPRPCAWWRGLESITGGQISIDEKVVNELPPMDRDIAMVFQNYALYPHMTVYDNMAFGLKMRKFDKQEIAKRVKEAADILGIQELLKRKPRQLSGGQRQRVALGRAIVRHPRVFLFDEPLSNLDAKLRVQMRVELEEAARAAWHHRDLRHARSGRGDDTWRPGRRHARRKGATGWRPDGAVQPARQSLRRGVHRIPGDEFRAGSYRRREWFAMGRERRSPHQSARATRATARTLRRDGGNSGRTTRGSAHRRRG